MSGHAYDVRDLKGPWGIKYPRGKGPFPSGRGHADPGQAGVGMGLDRQSLDRPWSLTKDKGPACPLGPEYPGQADLAGGPYPRPPAKPGGGDIRDPQLILTLAHLFFTRK